MVTWTAVRQLWRKIATRLRVCRDSYGGPYETDMPTQCREVAEGDRPAVPRLCRPDTDITRVLESVSGTVEPIPSSRIGTFSVTLS
ncbi:hypothetical protein D8Y22_07575 [Salinadaptatus halalkaliphilus]|uniref:Uncharacterized protein n=1 Tax=Salinadaptatus halalkaliphilus TaxID=2419781 RepID=A0A4V3VLB8_9EURY|nr:hypothetical protein D8Y22_07575 [Salinadaptatus halalkaliphilus]